MLEVVLALLKCVRPLSLSTCSVPVHAREWLRLFVYLATSAGLLSRALTIPVRGRPVIIDLPVTTSGQTAT